MIQSIVKQIIQHISIVFILCALSACQFNTLNFNQGIHDFKIQNYRSAFIRLMPEAQKGNPDAQYAIGYMYYYGEGVVENRKRAMEWIRKASNQGQEDAQSALKLMYQEIAQYPQAK